MAACLRTTGLATRFLYGSLKAEWPALTGICPLITPSPPPTVLLWTK